MKTASESSEHAAKRQKPDESFSPELSERLKSLPIELRTQAEAFFELISRNKGRSLSKIIVFSFDDLPAVTLATKGLADDGANVFSCEAGKEQSAGETLKLSPSQALFYKGGKFS